LQRVNGLAQAAEPVVRVLPLMLIGIRKPQERSIRVKVKLGLVSELVTNRPHLTAGINRQLDGPPLAVGNRREVAASVVGVTDRSTARVNGRLELSAREIRKD